MECLIRNTSLASTAKINGLAVIDDFIYVAQTNDPRIGVYDKCSLNLIKLLPEDDNEIPTGIAAVRIPILRENDSLDELSVFESNDTSSLKTTRKRKPQLPDIVKECEARSVRYIDLLFVCLKDRKQITCFDPNTGAVIYRTQVTTRPVHISAGLCEDAETLSALCGYSGSYKVSLFIVSDRNLTLINEVTLAQFNSVHCAALLPDSTFDRQRILVASKGRLSLVTYFPKKSEVRSDSGAITTHTKVDEILSSSFVDDPGENCDPVQNYFDVKFLTFPADLAIDAFAKCVYIAQCSDNDGKLVTCRYDGIPRVMSEIPQSLSHCLCFDSADRKLYVGSARGTISVLRC